MYCKKIAESQKSFKKKIAPQNTFYQTRVVYFLTDFRIFVWPGKSPFAYLCLFISLKTNSTLTQLMPFRHKRIEKCANRIGEKQEYGTSKS